MLCWHKFNLEKAMADLPNFTPFPDEWTVEDKVLFEQAFQFHDKHFHKIRQMVSSRGEMCTYRIIKPFVLEIRSILIWERNMHSKKWRFWGNGAPIAYITRNA